MISNIVKELEHMITTEDGVIMKDKINGEIVEKVYQKNFIGQLDLIKVKDSEGLHRLTIIPNFSRYLADLDRGKIYSIKSNRWLTPKANKRFGYVYSTLLNDDGEATPISIHQIMMSAHKQQEPKAWQKFGLEIDHVNGNKADNSIENLRLVAHKEQFCNRVREKMSRANAKRLTNEQVRYLRLMKEILEAKGEYAQNKFCNYFSEKFERTYTTIQNIVNDVTYVDVQLTDKEKELINKIRVEQDLARLSA